MSLLRRISRRQWLLKNPYSTLPHSSFPSDRIINRLDSPRLFPAIFPHRRLSDLPAVIDPKTLNFRSNGESATETNPKRPICPGCGVYMQDHNPKLPGFFIKPLRMKKEKLGFKFLSDDELPKNPNPNSQSDYTKSSDIKANVSSDILLSENLNPDSDSSNSALVVSSASESDSSEGKPKPVVCARCHSLRYYGRVKEAAAENLLPDFDFDHYLGGRLSSSKGKRSVVLLVVDATDFDGSFPVRVANLVSKTIEEDSRAWKEGKPSNVPRLVLAVTKIDLLPSSISPTGLEQWIRQRARESGAFKLASVHMVSAVRGWGIQNLIEKINDLVGLRGNVWAIGAQNAGKSTLINAIGKHVNTKAMHLTEAPVPGTTIGIIGIEGVLPGMSKLFDTPGILHAHQITTRLTRDEQKLVHIGKELKPRTYRLKAGYSVHIGGLIRLDVEETSVDTIYITIWASPLIPLHMGNTEHASNMVGVHFGQQLQPPIGEKRVKELGKWMRREYRVCCNSWDVSSVDIAAAGLGWYAIGLKGEATLGVWTYDGIGVSVRNSLLPYRAREFETAGFTVSKIVSRADKGINKLHPYKRLKRSVEVKEDKGKLVYDAEACG